VTDAPALPLDRFNAAPREEVVDALVACADVPRWAHELADARPFADAGTLLAAAGTAAALWSDDDVDGALARHPRIGERPVGGGAEAAASRREQAGVDGVDADVAARLADGNRRYEQRFGRVFLIRAAGRGPDEILAELERRLTLPADVERRVVAENLREIAVLRLAALVGAPSHVTTHVLDAATGRPAAGLEVALEALHPDGDAPVTNDEAPARALDQVPQETSPSDPWPRGTWRRIARAATDDDGRVRDLGPAVLHPGTYRVRFATGAWFAARGVEAFYPEVTVAFTLGAPGQPGAGHYHVPLLLSPFAYSTYRGS
jgi:hydroxyisourate hydrolase